MELPIRPNSGTGLDRLDMSFYGEIYTHGQYHQLLIVKEKYDTSKDIDTCMSLTHDFMFTKM